MTISDTEHLHWGHDDRLPDIIQARIAKAHQVWQDLPATDRRRAYAQLRKVKDAIQRQEEA